MGLPELAKKWPKITKCPVTHGGRRRRFAGLIPAPPTAVGREILRPASSGGGAPHGLAPVQ